jgi:S1-C subfamily serine protease
MNKWKVIVPAAAILLFAGQAAAQTEEERLREAEVRELEMEERMRAAEARMEAAAREIAEITKERLPQIVEFEKRFEYPKRPMLGVNIQSEGKSDPVEGVEITGVTPGSAASDAGLRAGDIITSVNDEPMSADSASVAAGRLLDFMNGVEEGDVLKLEYQRAGKVGSVEVEPRVMPPKAFAWSGKRGPNAIHVAPVAPVPGVERFAVEFTSPWAHTSLGDLELVELNEGLGRYFGTDTGLLVVKAPKSGAFELEEGDVIQSIDGREPQDVRHAMRILASYTAGEELELGIMRDKRKRTIDVEIPEDRTE